METIRPLCKTGGRTRNFVCADPVEMKKQEIPPNGRTNSPTHLSPGTAQWWRSVMSEYALEPHHIRLLTLAAEAYDSAQDAREIFSVKARLFIDRFDQPKPRPEVAIQRDSAIGFARMLRELDLEYQRPTDRARPPASGFKSGRSDAVKAPRRKGSHIIK